MRSSPRLPFALVLALALAFAGCASPDQPPGDAGGDAGVPRNMPELKEALGVTPDRAPPLAKAQANATTVSVGWLVRFTADGSSDPQGLALAYAWDFGDGETGTGAEATHAYAKAGEYAAKLTLTNTAELADEAVVPIRVTAQDLPPTAIALVTDANGNAVTTAERRATLHFDATGSSDPEGAGLSYFWDFGDGSTTADAKATHAYEGPGQHVVKLVVQDAAGLSTVAQRTLCVSATVERTGTVDLTSDVDPVSILVGGGLARLVATLTFDAALGANDLTLIVKDPGDRELKRAEGPTPAGAQGTQTRVATLDADVLALGGGGEWTFEVRREASGPASVPYSLVVREACA